MRLSHRLHESSLKDAETAQLTQSRDTLRRELSNLKRTLNDTKSQLIASFEKEDLSRNVGPTTEKYSSIEDKVRNILKFVIKELFESKSDTY